MVDNKDDIIMSNNINNGPPIFKLSANEIPKPVKPFVKYYHISYFIFATPNIKQ